MGLRIILIALFSICLFDLSVFGQTHGTVNKNKANLRMFPTVKSPILHQISKEDTVLLLKKTEFHGWYFVQYSEVRGWMHKSTLKLFDVFDELADRYDREQAGKQNQAKHEPRNRPNWQWVTASGKFVLLVDKANIERRKPLVRFWTYVMSLDDYADTHGFTSLTWKE